MEAGRPVGRMLQASRWEMMVVQTLGVAVEIGKVMAIEVTFEGITELDLDSWLKGLKERGVKDNSRPLVGWWLPFAGSRED